MNKYRNKKIVIDGIKFDSIAEGRRYKELKILEKGNYITDLKLQPKFDNAKGEHVRAITYKADFSYIENGKIIVEDVKGVITKEFAIKKKLFEYKYKDVEFRLIK